MKKMLYVSMLAMLVSNYVFSKDRSGNAYKNYPKRDVELQSKNKEDYTAEESFIDQDDLSSRIEEVKRKIASKTYTQKDAAELASYAHTLKNSIPSERDKQEAVESLKRTRAALGNKAYNEKIKRRIDEYLSKLEKRA